MMRLELSGDVVDGGAERWDRQRPEPLFALELNPRPHAGTILGMVARERRALRKAATVVAFVSSCVVLAMACGGSSSTPPQDGGACVPGASIACSGPGGCTGYQQCNQEGSRFESCNCAVDAAQDATQANDAPGDTTVDVHSSSDASQGDASSDAGSDVADGFAPNDGPAVVNGAIQKGPFVLGSSISLSAIDTSGVPTGQVFNTQTSDNLGDFSVSFAYRGNVDMQAQGFYYDEVTGALSSATIVLRALYQVNNGGPQSAYINIITHLAHDRALALMGDGGISLPSAEAQAEAELVSALGIGGAGFQPGGVGVNLNEVGGDNDSNAYLFAVSAVLVQAAREQAGSTGSVDAQLQQLLDTIAADLLSGGPLPSGLISQLRSAEQDLDVDLAMDFFTSRLQAIGSNATAADLNRAIDSDGDGYRNSVDTCPLVANPTQVVPTGVLCRATRHTAFPSGSSSETGCAPNPVLGDFTNAGFVGLLVPGLDGDSAPEALFIGDGTGRFSAASGVTLPTGFCPTMAFDVNADSKLDLVSQTGWVAGDGTGAFGAFNGFPVASTDGAADTYAGSTLANFNGDAFTDVARLVTDGSAAVTLAVSLGTSKGTFGAASTYSLGNIPIPVLDAGVGNLVQRAGHGLYLADLNGDSTPDLVAAIEDDTGSNNDPNMPMPAWMVPLVGDGSGGFQSLAPVPVGAASALGSPWGAGIADVDGDGSQDIVQWTTTREPNLTEVITVVFGNGTGAFSPTAVTVLADNLGSNFAGPVTFAVGDFNSDGKADLAGFTPSTDGVSNYCVVLASRGRTFESPQILKCIRPSETNAYVSNLGGGTYWWLQSGDLNADGVPDTVLVSTDFPASGTGTGAWSIQATLMNVQQ